MLGLSNAIAKLTTFEIHIQVWKRTKDLQQNNTLMINIFQSCYTMSSFGKQQTKNF